MSAFRVQQLEEENAFLKRQLGIETDREVVRKLADALSLTRYEARALALLYAKNGTVSRDGIMDAMYAGDNEPNIKIVDIWVCKLRRKLGDGIIHSLWGLGYQLTPEGRSMCLQALAGELRR